MKIYNVDKNLYDVRLAIDAIGINNFLSTWIYKDEKFTFVVDPGPTALLSSLIEALSCLNVNETGLDYVLLTHIHIDHAGSTGNLLKLFPDAKLVCHPSAFKHLVHPEKLWNASLESLGDLALLYGKIIPVSKQNFAIPEQLDDTGITTIETLGHAPHHQSYLFKNCLFAGEVAGTIKQINNTIYMRPATPPIFNYDAWIHSIKGLLSMKLNKYCICYAHYGYKQNAHKMLKLAYHQLKMWHHVLSELPLYKDDKDLIKRSIAELTKKDKFFARYKLLDSRSLDFELNLISNSIKGILNNIQTTR